MTQLSTAFKFSSKNLIKNIPFHVKSTEAFRLILFDVQLNVQFQQMLLFRDLHGFYSLENYTLSQLVVQSTPLFLEQTWILWQQIEVCELKTLLVNLITLCLRRWKLLFFKLITLFEDVKSHEPDTQLRSILRYTKWGNIWLPWVSQALQSFQKGV